MIIRTLNYPYRIQYSVLFYRPVSLSIQTIIQLFINAPQYVTSPTIAPSSRHPVSFTTAVVNLNPLYRDMFSLFSHAFTSEALVMESARTQYQ